MTQRPTGRIAIGNRCEYEYEYEYRDAEYEYEKKDEQSIGPKSSIERFGLVKNLLLAIGQSESIGIGENDSVQHS